jgi:hypothetical protein
VRGDFSDIRFDVTKHFSRVLQQQGRVQLDSDQNEQVEILLHYLRTLARDLIGPYGGPGDSFKIVTASDSNEPFAISPGHYYVDGILCELEAQMSDGNPIPVPWTHQPDYRLGGEPQLPAAPYLVYLDVWERFVSAAEDDTIREVALNGPDTTGRSRIVWQVRTFPLKGGETCAAAMSELRQANPGWTSTLEARTQQNGQPEGPCLVPPSSTYRGEENQLYRVEIHHGGTQWAGNGDGPASSVATFKWARDNASNVFPVRNFAGDVVTLEYLGRDRRTDRTEGDLVEVEYEDWVLGDRTHDPDPLPLLEIAAIDREAATVTLGGNLDDVTDGMRASATLLRRWDRAPGAAPNQAGFADDGSTLAGADWIPLEAGIEVRLDGGGRFTSGDYWLIPARVALGDIRWPRDSNGDPLPESPRGVEHRYAPLAIVTGPKSFQDCRCVFAEAAVCK